MTLEDFTSQYFRPHVGIEGRVGGSLQLSLGVASSPALERASFPGFGVERETISQQSTAQHLRDPEIPISDFQIGDYENLGRHLLNRSPITVAF